MSNIIIFPDYAKLKDEIAELKERFINAVNERDELTFVICPNIETKYELLFGDLEYKALNAEIAYRRIKRKAELVNARKNKGQRIKLSEIEMELDDEFKAFADKLAEKLDNIERALRRSKKAALSKQEAANFKKMYREIVRKLHPDMHPDESREELELFFHAVEAYACADVATIEFIYSLVCEGAETEKRGTITELTDERDRLKGAICALEEEIAAIKRNHPYSAIDLLENDKRISEHKQTLEKAISDYKASIKVYEDKIKELCGG